MLALIQKMALTDWKKIRSDKFQEEWENRFNEDVLRLIKNRGSSYVLLISGNQRRFIYQATPTKQVSQSGAISFARSYRRLN